MNIVCVRSCRPDNNEMEAFSNRTSKEGNASTAGVPGVGRHVGPANNSFLTTAGIAHRYIAVQCNHPWRKGRQSAVSHLKRIYP